MWKAGNQFTHTQDAPLRDSVLRPRAGQFREPPVSRCPRYPGPGRQQPQHFGAGIGGAVHSGDLIDLSSSAGLPGERALLLHQQRGRRGRPAHPPAPPGGRAGNGAALSAPRCRCSRRSAGAGVTAACVSASARSALVRTWSSARRPCPRVLHPGRPP